MLKNNVEMISNNLVSIIRKYWNDNVSQIKVSDLLEEPFEQFCLTMVLYKKHLIKLEYDRSTISIFVMINNEYIVLSRLTDRKVFRGFESSEENNLIANFKVLDEVLNKL